MAQAHLKQLDKEIISRVKHLSNVKKQEILDFISFLSTKSEWEATFEMRSDKELTEQAQLGIKDIQNGNLKKFNPYE